MSDELRLLYSLELRGIEVHRDGDRMRLAADRGVITQELRARVASNKGALLELLDGPRIISEREWKQAVDEVARKHQDVLGRHPDLPWLDDGHLVAEVGSALLADDLESARSAISKWKAAWEKLLAECLRKEETAECVATAAPQTRVR